MFQIHIYNEYSAVPIHIIEAEGLSERFFEDGRSILVINKKDTYDIFMDRGEPEDNSFLRDYSWIASSLEKAYQQGLEEGHELGFFEGKDSLDEEKVSDENDSKAFDNGYEKGYIDGWEASLAELEMVDVRDLDDGSSYLEEIEDGISYEPEEYWGNENLH